MNKQQYLKFLNDYKEIVTLVYDIKELLDDHINIRETESTFLVSDKNNLKDRYREILRKIKPDIHAILQELGVFKYNFTRLTKDNRTYNSTDLLPACVISEIYEKLSDIENKLKTINN
jgi:gluconate kinase